MKVCNSCKLNKEYSQFRTRKNIHNTKTVYFRNICKICEKVYDKLRKLKSKNKSKLNRKNYYLLNKIKENNNSKIYYNSNKLKINKARGIYHNRKMINDPSYRLRYLVSKSIYKALKKQNLSKNNSSIWKYLNYNKNDLKIHIENLFENWMNWNNWGRYNAQTWDDNDESTWTWNIDHIIPQSKLPYQNMEDINFKKCWALNNLRPYSAKRNIIDKNNR